MSGEDDNEKGIKVRRQARARAKNALACLGLMTTCFLVIIFQLSKSPGKVMKGKLRRARQELEHETAKLESFDLETPLPPNSIYRLSVNDELGEPWSLGDYAGKVTLIVNTACK
jgi:hypothetical protein